MRKNQSSGNTTRIFIFLLVVGIILLAGYLIFREGTLPVNEKNTATKIFVIPPGQALSTISKRLESEGLIRNRLVFFTVIKERGIDKKIQAGSYRLSPSMNAYTLAEELTHGTNDTWITIIEGQRKEEIADTVANTFGIKASEFIAAAKEGYLFPDTYLFPNQVTAEDITTALYKNYKTKVTPDILASAKENGLSEDDLITLASLVEREARTEESRRMVASILLHRIEEKMPLQIDATVQYVLGYDKEQKTWWRKGLTLDNLKFQSFYNTYVNPGLPPGPICSPSLSSIIAVSEADPNTPYLFYITGKDNKMHYAKTYEDHQKNIEVYGVH
jgi:UPF0755 protein